LAFATEEVLVRRSHHEMIRAVTVVTLVLWLAPQAGRGDDPGVEETPAVGVCQPEWARMIRVLAGPAIRVQILEFPEPFGGDFREENRWMWESHAAQILVVDEESDDPLETFWRERLAGQGVRLVALPPLRPCGCPKCLHAQRWRQLHTILSELLPAERARLDERLRRALRRSAHPGAAPEFAVRSRL
jgi:hypothetical protein